MKTGKIIFLFLSFMFLVLFAYQASAYDRITISDPALRKIPLGVNIFRVSPRDKTLALKAPDIISSYLGFTGYFKILDRGLFLTDPDNPETDASTINFKNWMTIGAELLITGNIIKNGNIIEMELRLFDPFKGELLVGKMYKGWQKDMERMLRKFCSEVIYHLTGDRGIFDSKIAFISNGSGHKEIYVCDFNGTNIIRITHNKSINLSPAWSWDGKWLAYTSYAKGRPDLYIKNLKENRGIVFSKRGINTTPAWMPGQFKLAATLSFTGDQDIYLLTGNGKIIKQLTRKYGIDTSPSWAPDGRRIAFVSARSGNPQIYIKDVGSGRVERLTFEGKYNTQPAWSPLGNKIAYSSIERGEINIHIIDLKTRRPLRLTYNSGKNESPSWSPDGSLIVFSSTREGGIAGIYVMTGFGIDQRRLLKMPGEQTCPAWSPAMPGN